MQSSRLALIAALAAAYCPAHAIMTIAVDVGHTLAQPGATSARGETEFSFNRALATTVQEALHGYWQPAWLSHLAIAPSSCNAPSGP